MSMDERLRLFYVDDLVPMMMQENYLNVDPALASKGGLPPQVRTLELIRYSLGCVRSGINWPGHIP